MLILNLAPACVAVACKCCANPVAAARSRQVSLHRFSTMPAGASPGIDNRRMNTEV